MSEDSYRRSLKRLLRFTLVAGVLGTLTAMVWRGPLTAVGFVAGALLSLINLRWWTMVANAIGGSGEAPRSASAIVLSLRYLFIGGAIYVIVRVFKITPVAPLAGLLVTVAAVIVEALYQLAVSE